MENKEVEEVKVAESASNAEQTLKALEETKAKTNVPLDVMKKDISELKVSREDYLETKTTIAKNDDDSQKKENVYYNTYKCKVINKNEISSSFFKMSYCQAKGNDSGLTETEKSWVKEWSKLNDGIENKVKYNVHKLVIIPKKLDIQKINDCIVFCPAGINKLVIKFSKDFIKIHRIVLIYKNKRLIAEVTFSAKVKIIKNRKNKIGIDVGLKKDNRLVGYDGGAVKFENFPDVTRIDKEIIMMRSYMQFWTLEDIKKHQKLCYKKKYIIEKYYDDIIKWLVLNYNQIIIENIDINNFYNRSYFSNKTVDTCKLGYFYLKLKEKCLEYNVYLKKVPKYYSSTKICSFCGRINDIGASDKYVCECMIGTIYERIGINRDLNAAKNLYQYDE